jgi:very-short-patch-repair endonuclease
MGKVEFEWILAMPLKRSTPKTKNRAGEFRKEPTAAEDRLWVYLRALREDGIHFRRQHAIGPYIADFAAPRRKLIIEVDGSPHGGQGEYDAERIAFFIFKVYRVRRFWNSDVLNKCADVAGMIMKELERTNPWRREY